MRKTLLTSIDAILVIGVFIFAFSSSGCRGWPQAHDDVVKIQENLHVLRQYVQPKEPTNTATINAIWDNTDASLDDMLELTK